MPTGYAGIERFWLQVDSSENALVLETTMGPKPTFLQRFDTGPPLRGTLYDAQGAVVDLTGATVTLDMRSVVTRQPKIEGAVVTVLGDPLEGRIEYAWQAIDTNVPGEYELWVRVDFGGGRRDSFPNKDAHRVVIRP